MKPFMEQPIKVKLKAVLCFVPNVILYGITCIGNLADRINDRLVSWVFKGAKL
jgi:hypothetical protein